MTEVTEKMPLDMPSRMQLKINTVADGGDFQKERIVLEAIEDCDLSDYLVMDYTHTRAGVLSNKIRHVFVSNPLPLKKGERVRIYSKSGKYSVIPERKDGSRSISHPKTHCVYWNLDTGSAAESTAGLWSTPGDCVRLVRISDHAKFVIKGKLAE